MDAPRQQSEPRAGEVLAALSYALDMVEGQNRGHAVRTWMICRQIALQLQLSEQQVSALFYASLLKDSGCSNNSARIQMILGGDEIEAKREVKFVDWTNPVESAKYALKHLSFEGGVKKNLHRFRALAGPPRRFMDEVTNARCTRGALVAKYLGFGQETADAIAHLDEHWDGKGSPDHLKGDQIPILARILCLAQTLEIFVTTYGVTAGFEILRRRSGRWFDPSVVTATLKIELDAEFWEQHARHGAGEEVSIDAPLSALELQIADLDKLCEAFATIVDAKSSFTAEHSTRVTEYALALARWFNFGPDQIQTLRRAALLHDIGKLGVSNSILDKPGRLDDAELASMRLHPRFTYEILKPIKGFERVTQIAAAHHERLDGKGYWLGLGAEHLDLDMRIVSAADVFDALSAKRPYRDALPFEKVMEIMWKDAGSALDPECVKGLQEIYSNEQLAQAA